MTEKAHSPNSPDRSSEANGERSDERVVIRDNRKVDRSSGVARGIVRTPDRVDAGGDEPPATPEGESTSAATAGSSDAGNGSGGKAANGDVINGEVVDGDSAGERGDAPATSADGEGASTDTAPENPAGKSAVGEVVDGEVLDGASRPDKAGTSGNASSDAKRAEAEIAELRGRIDVLRRDLNERTIDLQRVTAEYANYRKRVDRDRTLVAEQSTGTVLAALLPVLDDLDRAREHGDLVGPFAAVADQLGTALTKFGLTAFGSKGDPFDPNRHEAVAHLTSPDVTEPTCIDVMRRGYLLGERLLRAAMVAVADPE